MRTTLAFTLATSLAPLAAAQVGSSRDLWDFSRGTTITAHSPFDDSHAGYDARDALGGAFHDYGPELGSVIFADFQQPGSIHSLEWRTPAPIDLERFTMACGADHHAEDLRATAAFRLYAREEPGAPWILLHEAARAPADILDHPLWTLDHEFDSPCRGLTEFRAEFVQASANTEYGGPRVYELDGFGEYTWVAASAGAHARKPGHAGAPRRKLKPGA
jgi:hypothetical protein